MDCTTPGFLVHHQLPELAQTHVSLVFKQVFMYLASLVAQKVKRLPAMQETWVPSLGQEDPLEKGMATHSSTLAWKRMEASLKPVLQPDHRSGPWW